MPDNWVAQCPRGCVIHHTDAERSVSLNAGYTEHGYTVCSHYLAALYQPA